MNSYPCLDTIYDDVSVADDRGEKPFDLEGGDILRLPTECITATIHKVHEPEVVRLQDVAAPGICECVEMLKTMMCSSVVKSRDPHRQHMPSHELFSHQ